jgi:hypothetical protein
MSREGSDRFDDIYVQGVSVGTVGASRECGRRVLTERVEATTGKAAPFEIRRAPRHEVDGRGRR